MIFTKGERDQIRFMLSDPKWRTIERVAEEVCKKIYAESKIRDTEWDTLKEVLTREGEAQGIKRFLQELYSQVAAYDTA